MRILVTGSRDWPSADTIQRTLLDWWLENDRPTATLVHGGAKGADAMAADCWRTQGFPIETHPADWKQYGKRAGYVRNAAMVNAGADVCIAFIYNGSRGATMCADLAEKAGIPTRRVVLTSPHGNKDTDNSGM